MVWTLAQNTSMELKAKGKKTEERVWNEKVKEARERRGIEEGRLQNKCNGEYNEL